MNLIEIIEYMYYMGNTTIQFIDKEDLTLDSIYLNFFIHKKIIKLKINKIMNINALVFYYRNKQYDLMIFNNSIIITSYPTI
jgi:hypothetical protein